MTTENQIMRAELYKRLGEHSDEFSPREKTTITGFIDIITADKPREPSSKVEEETSVEPETVKGVFPIGH